MPKSGDTVVVHGAPPQYARAPRDLLRNAGLSVGARLLWIHIEDHDNGSGEAPFPSQGTLAGYLGVSVRTVYAWTQELVEAGLLAVERRGLRRSNRYHLYWPGVSDRKPASTLDRKPASDEEEPLEEEPLKETPSSPPRNSRARRAPRREALKEKGEQTAERQVLASRPPAPPRSLHAIVRSWGDGLDLPLSESEVTELVAGIKTTDGVHSPPAFLRSEAGRDWLEVRTHRLRHGRNVYNPADERRDVV